MDCDRVWGCALLVLLGCQSGARAPAQPTIAAPEQSSAEMRGSNARVSPQPAKQSNATVTPASPRAATEAIDAGMDDASEPSRNGAASATLAARICPARIADPDPALDGSVVALVRDGFRFLEGPVWLDSPAALLFSDMDFAGGDSRGPPSRMWRLQPPDAFAVLAADANTNGLALDVDGSVLACTHDVQSLSRFDPVSGARVTLDLRWMGHHFNSPNDLVVRSDGSVYFTDPNYQLGARSSETGMTGVYRLTPENEVELVTAQLDQPNGIALSLDEHTLYVGSAGSDVMMYDVADDGSVQADAGKVFASPGASDGMTVDCAGNLYVIADKFVHVFSSAGATLGRIELPEQPSNVAFGGSDHRTLYITASTGLYSVRGGVPGLPY
jgi:gluconolactonase